jgi:hypothetical protein
MVRACNGARANGGPPFRTGAPGWIRSAPGPWCPRKGVLVADGFRPFAAPISVSNQPPASRPRDLPASARPHLPKRCSRKASSRRARSPTLRMPSAFRCFSVTLPTPGTLRTSSGARKAASWPGITHSTPLGLAWSELILATRREAAIPMEQFRPVSAFMRWCSRCAARKAGPYRRSVPVISR